MAPRKNLQNKPVELYPLVTSLLSHCFGNVPIFVSFRHRTWGEIRASLFTRGIMRRSFYRISHIFLHFFRPATTLDHTKANPPLHVPVPVPAGMEVPEKAILSLEGILGS